jgi:hypothetical protein
VQLAPEFTQMIEEMEESAAESGGEFSSDMNMESLDEWVAQAEEAGGREDLNVTFNQEVGDDGSQTYIVQAEGQQYETLNEIFFEGEADISVEVVDGQRQVTIRHTFSSEEFEAGSEPQDELSPEMAEQMAEGMEMFGFANILRITGGEIINSNASRVEGNTAIWENPIQVEITLAEAAEFSPDSIALQEMEAGAGLLLENLESMVDSDLAENTPESTTSTESTTASEDVAAEDASTESTEVAAETTDTAEALAPAGENNSLPQSGGVLREDASGGPLALAGLVLISLVGGAITAFRRDSTKTW